MARSTRGGKRGGAGRKPVLAGEYDRLWIGGRCEDLWREECRKALDAAIAKATAIVEVEYAKLRAVPVRERKFPPAREGWKLHVENVNFALREQQGTPFESEPSEYNSVSAPRPKGKRKAIIAQVSAEGTTRYGVKVSMRLVEACWKEFRRFEEDIIAQQGEYPFDFCP